MSNLCNCSIISIWNLWTVYEFILIWWPVSGPNRVGDQSVPPTQTRECGDCSENHTGTIYFDVKAYLQQVLGTPTLNKEPKREKELLRE